MAMEEYFKRFSVVEVQQTFYHPPRAETLARWRALAPAGFEFALKAWQLITHEPDSPTYRRLKAPVPEAMRKRYGAFRPTDEVMAAWRTTLEAARALKASIIVFQCPASFTPTLEHVKNLRAFFRAIRKEAEGLVLGWEPRGNWPRDIVTPLCADLGLIHVVDPLQAVPPQTAFRYFRLHGVGNYHYRYTDSDLLKLLSLCGKITYCLFNNSAMAEDASRFQALVR